MAHLSIGTTTRVAAAVVLTVCCAVACSSAPAKKTATQCRAAATHSAPTRTVSDAPPPVPETGAYLGAFSLDKPTFTQHQYLTSTAALEVAICRPLDIVHTYLQWDKPFPTESQLAASRRGQILLLSWTGTDMASMASGRDDAEIRTVAAEVASLRSPVFVELRWEMDRPNLRSIVGSPAVFIAAWDRARAVFAQAHVRNASWVWCPTATGFDRGDAPQYYPGGDEVDWICTDAYPTPGAPVEQLKTELATFLKWAEPQGKPLMLGEIGVPQNYPPDARADWISNAADFVKDTPQIKAVVYFNYNPVGHQATRDYRIEPGSRAAAALRALGADPWFNPKPG